MIKKQEQHIKARLYLYGVLGAIPKLLRLVPRAAEMLEGQNFSIAFSTRSNLRVTLFFKDGIATFVPDREVDSDMALFFINDSQLIKLFDQKGVSLPVPVRGILQMHKLRQFKNLADLLQSYLKPSDELKENPDFLMVHVKMVLGLVVRSLCQLGMHDPAARDFLNSGPKGLAAFSVAGEEEAAWILHDGSTLESGFGTPPREPDVHVHFKDVDTALGSLEEKIDVASAVGMGSIEVSGMVPLADNLGYLMLRIPHYI